MPSEYVLADDLLDQFDHDLELLADVRDTFSADVGHVLEALEASASAGDGSGVAKLAHRLRGSLATFHAPIAAGTAGELESLAREGNLSAVLLLSPRLREEIAHTFTAIERLLVNAAGAHP